MSYKPKAIDIAWAKKLMQLTREGKLIRFPSPDLIYRRKGNQLVLVSGDQNNGTHLRTINVFTQAGFVVTCQLEPRSQLLIELVHEIKTTNNISLLDDAGIMDLTKLLQSVQNN
jgi:hypothetical protein